MAWHSSGSTNDELVNNLVVNGLITDNRIASAFRNVDRAHFVPTDSQEYAYSDRPLKEGNVHISAPHIYCTVVENLALEADSDTSFLNIGVGTGYLTCIVAHILGRKSQCYGVEIHSDVIQHCQNAISAWKESMDEEMTDPSIFHGNGLEILDEGETSLGYDRIYVGAEIESEDLDKLKNLLAEGGILVVPMDGYLTKVVKVDGYQVTNITGVHFAPLLKSPSKSVVIPATKWNPSSHHLYPESFKKAATHLLLCSNSPYNQPPPQSFTKQRVNVTYALPQDVWAHVLSFTNRKWFDPRFSEKEVLKRKLAKEEARTAELRTENQELRTGNALLEHERDLYMSVINQMRSEVRRALNRRESEVRLSTTSSHSNQQRQDLSQDPFHRTSQTLLREMNQILSTCRGVPLMMDMDLDLDLELDAAGDMDIEDEDDEEVEEDDDDDTSEWGQTRANNSHFAADEDTSFNRVARSQQRTVSISTDEL